MTLLDRPTLATPTTAAPPPSAIPTAPTPAPVTQSVARRAGRDPFLDLLRAVGTVAVILAHWLMPQVSWDGATLHVTNVLGEGAGWVVTWVIQVIPLMFFVAGAATFSQLDRRWVPWGPFVTSRVRRLLPPVAVFAGVWLAIAVVLPELGAPRGAVRVAATIAPQLLWYLGVYVILVACSHLLRACYLRARVASLLVLGGGAVLVDVLRFAGGVEQIAVANLFLVWAFAYTLGFAYADGLFDAVPRRACAALSGLGFVALVAAVTLGPYPLSMVGMPGDAFSNMGPPTVCLVALTLAQVFGALALRPVIVGCARQTQVAAVLGWISARSMTLYLWHLTAMFAVVGVVVLGANLDLPEGWSGTWWETRPVWFAACAAVLALLVRVFAPVELRRPARSSIPGAAPASRGDTARERPAGQFAGSGIA
ncbi:Acyltransferase family protein [Sanguibacter gelidistatuariae]|uniref:Acyltransferase family protein n=1 Tax=Sanguibacter gelidistatuariae TaxID=1814289 RepID=A0A1G6VUW6_9MICO|nr:acyltransferase [Sanguibacter gelidistatuariae]SDD57314.1 Acyltransferase family protein [Sanguibacter gelidistatuariae]